MRITQLIIIAVLLTAGFSQAENDSKKLFEEFEKVIRSHNTDDVIAFMKTNPRAIKALDHQKCTPLHEASKNGTASIVKAMLAKGADVNAKTDNGWTPLHYACLSSFNSNKSIIEVLLKQRANFNARDDAGKTPIFNTSNVDDISYLISKGAKINVVDKYGLSLLLNACDKGRPEAIDFYLKKQLDPKLRTKDGRTALHLICNHFTNLDTLKMFLKFGLDVNSVDEYGKTPLHAEIISVRKDSAEVVAVLLEAGAKVDIPDKNNDQPLNAMCNRWLDAGKEDDYALAVAKLLVANGADVNAKDTYGRTALDDLLGRDDSPTKTIEFLKSKGAIPGKEKE